MNRPAFRPSWLALAAALALSACGTVTTVPLSDDDIRKVNETDAKAARAEVPPIDRPLTLDEALASLADEGVAPDVKRRV